MSAGCFKSGPLTGIFCCLDAKKLFIAYFSLSCRETLNLAGQSTTELIPRQVLHTFNKQVLKYYEGRVKSVLDRTRNFEGFMLDLEYAARVIIRGSVTPAFSYGFESSGLITSKGSIVCNQAKNAIIQVFNIQRKDLIRELVGLFCIC